MTKALSLIVLFFVSNVYFCNAQEIMLNLTPQPEFINSSIYEIAEVHDTRPQSEKIGLVYREGNKMVNARFPNSLAHELQNYFSNSIQSRNPQLQKIIVKIEKYDLVENLNSNQIVEGELKIKFGFYAKGSFDPVHLLDFEGGMSYKRSKNRVDLIQNVIQQASENALKYFDQWINSQAMTNRSLANKVRLEVNQPILKSSSDTVFYNSKRGLGWQDFTAKPHAINKYNALIFTSLSMEGKPYVEDATIVLPLIIKVYMLPDQSWVKNKDDYSLNHEQRHFDVTKVVGDRLQYKLKKLDLNPENYEGLVNSAYLDAYREMSLLQKLYDSQTNHGRDASMQAKWNRYLDDALQGDWKNIETIISEKM
ncbi:hypothetical protein ACFOUP_08010 [Belliella kenyensis]|uniref:DUF922 domain-containing protein n=1 Tax=Belliella kenyensis TaxID=1472724 RepID=A0ABV8EJ38_9BACT|nr:hypothetical protein [Belliella kenyensis]MCH7400418.1 hypothetical protein [Belliella kenyensis]MDN3604565.1 hypothetical protein [Belliella kenyensis]